MTTLVTLLIPVGVIAAILHGLGLLPAVVSAITSAL